MRIVVTAIGSVSGPFVVKRLKALGHRVVGINVATEDVPPAAQFCDSFHVVRHSDDGTDYQREILGVASTVRADRILPLTDPETWLLAQARAMFAGAGIDVECSSVDSLRRVRDKLNLAREAGELKIDGFAVIPSYPRFESAVEHHRLPIVAKPRVGRSSGGFRILHAAERMTNRATPALVYQPFIDGQVVTVDAARIGSQTTCCSRVELVRSSKGLGLSVEVFEDPKLVRIVSELLDFFGVSGLVNLEFIRRDDTYFLMDFNLRASAGLAFSYRAGADFLERVFGRGESVQNALSESANQSA